MFIILLNYLKPLEMVDALLAQHRQYLDQGYQQGLLLASGPQIPRVGGVLLSAYHDKRELEAFLAHDPFIVHQVGCYQILEFNPVKATELFYAAIK